MNWRERLDRAKQAGTFTETDKTGGILKDWMTSPIGDFDQATARFIMDYERLHVPPEYKLGSWDERLYVLGLDFRRVVRDNDIDEAERLYDAIRQEVVSGRALLEHLREHQRQVGIGD